MDHREPHVLLVKAHSRVTLSVHACSVSRVSLFVTLWTVACQAPLSTGFYRQEKWSGLPCPPLGDLPNPGMEASTLTSPALAGWFFTTTASWEALYTGTQEGNICS